MCRSVTIMRDWIRLVEQDANWSTREWYADGGCHALAFALHWMCGWPIKAIEDDSRIYHFSAEGPDGLAWDAYGPRAWEEARDAYNENAEVVDFSPKELANICSSEEEITQACKDAQLIFGEQLTPHIKRTPE